jgi:hypothetical protein
MINDESVPESLGNPLAAAAAPSVTREQEPHRPPLAVVTGASSGIGYELARECGKAGYDMVIAADEAEIHEVAKALRGLCGEGIESVQCDLSTPDGVEKLVSRVADRPVDALLANAGRALGHAFLDQDLDVAMKVVRTNVEGTARLIHRLGGPMRARGRGRILITSSIAAFSPAPYMALYNALAAAAGAETVNFDKEEPYDRLNQLTGGRGPDSCIDAVGMEAHGSGSFDAVLDRGEAALGIATDRIHALRACISNCRCGGTVSLSGVYGGFLNHLNLGAAFQKGLTIRMGQCNVMNYMDELMRMIEEGEFDPSFVITHKVALDDAPDMYETFKKKEDGCIKVVMKPNG